RSERYARDRGDRDRAHGARVTPHGRRVQSDRRGRARPEQLARAQQVPRAVDETHAHTLRSGVRVVVQHRSRYVYPRPTLLGPQMIRLRPADHARARIETYALSVSPEHRVHWQRDPDGNHVARVTFKVGQAVRELAITVELAVDVRPLNPFDFFVDDR